MTTRTGVPEVGRDFQARWRWARSESGRLPPAAVRSRDAWRDEARWTGAGDGEDGEEEDGESGPSVI